MLMGWMSWTRQLVRQFNPVVGYRVKRSGKMWWTKLRIQSQMDMLDLAALYFGWLREEGY